jgi:predicted dehydrogenase
MAEGGDVVSLALVGIGGYGNTYVNAVLDAPEPRHFRFAAAVDPNPTSCRRLTELESRGVTIYPSLEAMYAEQRPDLVALSTPLHLHAQQTCFALERGSHVLCEKPLCVTPRQIREMTDARERADRIVAIGYQWSFSDAVQRLKGDVMSGRLGRPKRLRTLVLWPRDEAYYGRSRWAGARTDAAGNPVLDSPVNNACAHYLHNMLYVLGPAVDRSTEPARVTAELYRANSIQNYDTAALRCTTADGVELLFVVSHATGTRHGPIFSSEFERGTVHYADALDDEDAGGRIIAHLGDGGTRDYGSPAQPSHKKLFDTIGAIRQGRRDVACGIEAAAAHTRCVWAAQQSPSAIRDFPRELVRVEGKPGHRRTFVEGLDDVLERCYDEAALPSELGISWAAGARDVTVAASDAADSF